MLQPLLDRDKNDSISNWQNVQNVQEFRCQIHFQCVASFILADLFVSPMLEELLFAK